MAIAFVHQYLRTRRPDAWRRVPACPSEIRCPLDDGSLFLTDAGMETALIFRQGRTCRASRPSRCSRASPAGTRSAPTTSRSSSSRARAGRDSSWVAAPGAPTPTGAPSWATTRTPSPPSIAARSSSSRSCGERAGHRPAGAAGGADRAARRRLRAVVADDCRGGGAIPLGADADARGHRRRAGHGAHAHLRGRRRSASCAPRGAAGLPVVVSFTVETDGRLPSGQTLRAAIEQVDAETDGAPLLYMINCAHPTHFAGALAETGRGSSASRGLRANASTPQPRASWTRPRASTTAIPPTSPSDMPRCATRSQPHDPGWLLRHGHPPRDEHVRRLARSRAGQTQVCTSGEVLAEGEHARVVEVEEVPSSSASGKVENFAITMRAGRCTRIDWPFMPSAAYMPRGPSIDPPLVVVEGVGPAGSASAEARKASISSASRTPHACDPVGRHDLLAERPAVARGTCSPKRARSRSVVQMPPSTIGEAGAVEHDLRVALGADPRPHLAREELRERRRRRPARAPSRARRSRASSSGTARCRGRAGRGRSCGSTSRCRAGSSPCRSCVR